MSNPEELKAKNTKVFGNLVKQWKTEWGNDWFTKNYCKFFLGFEDDVDNFQSWKNQLSKLSADLSSEQKQLVALYEELLQSYEASYLTKEKWWFAKDAISKQRRFLNIYDNKSAELEEVLAPLKQAKADGKTLLQAIYSKDPVAVKKVLYSWKSDAYLLGHDIHAEFTQIGLLQSRIKIRTHQIFPPEELTIDASQVSETTRPIQQTVNTPSKSPLATPPNQSATFYAGYFFARFKKPIVITIAGLVLLKLGTGFFESTFDSSNTNQSSALVAKDLQPHSKEYQNLMTQANQCSNNECIQVILNATYPRAQNAINLAYGRLRPESTVNWDHRQARLLNGLGLDSIYQAKDLNLAEYYFQEAVKNDSSDPEIVANLAYAMLENGKYEKAEAETYKAIALKPNRVESWTTLIRIYCNNDQPLKATQVILFAYGISSKKESFYTSMSQKAETASTDNLQKAYRDAKSIIDTQQ
jgi:tetratricopeptide (TPR) repeat protein